MLDHEFQLSDVLVLANASARTSTFTSPVQDLLPLDGDLMLLQNVGTVTGTSPTLAGALQDSDDGSTGWANVTGVAFVTVTSSFNTQKLIAKVNGVRRFVRYVGTIGGTTPSFTFTVLALARSKVE